MSDVDIRDRRLDDIDLGTIDGAAVRVARRYRGDLTTAERVERVSEALQAAQRRMRATRLGSPAFREAFVGGFVDVFRLGLDYGLRHEGIVEMIRLAGAEFGSTRPKSNGSSASCNV
jgi:hypothetical protein